MQIRFTDRGFRILEHPDHLDAECQARLVQESSTTGGHEDATERPGASFLWIGDRHHLTREEVGTLASVLQHWLQHGCLPEDLG